VDVFESMKLVTKHKAICRGTGCIGKKVLQLFISHKYICCVKRLLRPCACVVSLTWFTATWTVGVFKYLKGGTASSPTTFRPVLQSFLLPTAFVSMNKEDRTRSWQLTSITAGWRFTYGHELGQLNLTSWTTEKSWFGFLEGKRLFCSAGLPGTHKSDRDVTPVNAMDA
jgi:hypothetical protein